jgi:hypothetical protein
MKTLLIRSSVIALVLAPVLSIAFHFPVKAFKIDPPLDPAKAETMSHEEMEAYYQAHNVEIGKFQWLVDSVRWSWFWKSTFQTSLFPFVVLFVACFGLGYWQRTRPC